MITFHRQIGIVLLFVLTSFVDGSGTSGLWSIMHNHGLAKRAVNMNVIDDIMKDYNKIARPNFGGKAVNVNISILVNDISSVSESEMEYKADFIIRHFWIDPRLAFSSNSSGLSQLTLSDEFLQKIWIPDSYFMNGKSLAFHLSMTSKNTNLMWIREDGQVFYSTRVTLTSQCTMDFTYFPVDQQICSLRMESYGYSDDEILYNWSTKPAAMTLVSGIQIPKYNLMGYKYAREVNVLETGNFSGLQCDFVLARSTSYYISRIFVPASLIVVISWVPFWLDHNDLHARVALGVTTVLTMTTLTNTASDDIPQVSYMKAIDIYLFVTFIMVFLSLIEYALVGYLAYKINKHHASIDQSKLNSNNSTETVQIEDYADSKRNSPKQYLQWAQAINNIDHWSRWIFPLFFILFNMVYLYVLWKIDRRQERVLNQFIKYHG